MGLAYKLDGVNWDAFIEGPQYGFSNPAFPPFFPLNPAIPPYFTPESRSRPIFYEIFCLTIEIYVIAPQGFRPQAKSREGTLVTRAYIKDSTYSSNIQSVY